MTGAALLVGLMPEVLGHLAEAVFFSNPSGFCLGAKLLPLRQRCRFRVIEAESGQSFSVGLIVISRKLAAVLPLLQHGRKGVDLGAVPVVVRGSLRLPAAPRQCSPLRFPLDRAPLDFFDCGADNGVLVRVPLPDRFAGLFNGRHLRALNLGQPFPNVRHFEIEATRQRVNVSGSI